MEVVKYRLPGFGEVRSIGMAASAKILCCASDSGHRWLVVERDKFGLHTERTFTTVAVGQRVPSDLAYVGVAHGHPLALVYEVKKGEKDA